MQESRRFGITIPDNIDDWTDSLAKTNAWYWTGANLDNLLIPKAGSWNIHCPSNYMWLQFLPPYPDISLAERLNLNAAMPMGAIGNLYITLMDKNRRQIQRTVYIAPAKVWIEIDLAIQDFVRIDMPRIAGDFDYTSISEIECFSEGTVFQFWIDQFYFYSTSTSTFFIINPEGIATASVKMEQDSWVETLAIPKTFSHDPSTGISLTALEPSGYTFKKWVINQQEYLNKQVGPMDFVAGGKNYIDVYYSGGNGGSRNILLLALGGILGVATLYYLSQHK